MLENLGFIVLGALLAAIANYLWQAWYWRNTPDILDEAYERGFCDGEYHALQCRGGPRPELTVVAEPQEGSQWGIGSGHA